MSAAEPWHVVFTALRASAAKAAPPSVRQPGQTPPPAAQRDDARRRPCRRLRDDGRAPPLHPGYGRLERVRENDRGGLVDSRSAANFETPPPKSAAYASRRRARSFRSGGGGVAGDAAAQTRRQRVERVVSFVRERRE